MKQTAVEWLAEQIYSKATFIAVANNEDELDIEVSVFKKIIQQAKEMERQQQEKTIEEVFEWLTTNNYLTDLKETLIENFKNK